MFSKTLIAVSLAASVLISTSAFALEKVDLLIRNSTVLTMDKDRTVLNKVSLQLKASKSLPLRMAKM
jgi:5-methylthioadenosine/S-adenosylhomocysteine deaminase